MRKAVAILWTTLAGFGFFGCGSQGGSGSTGSGGAAPGAGGASSQGGGSGGVSQPSGGAGGGSGGVIASGGVSADGGSAMGGRAGTGGATATGGASADAGVATGGRTGTGGASGGLADAGVATGGRTGTGGGTATGGTTASTGGSTGGQSGTGGATATGGRATGGSGTGGSGTGGANGTGGSTSKAPYKGVANSPAAELAALGSTWCYNWTTAPQASDCNDPYFVPMIWGGSNVAAAIKAIGDAGYTTVLGFNEPNKSDQANMTVDAAIALWPTLTSNPNIRVGSPAVSDDGRAWLESFMTQVKAKGLRVDFIAMHWYGWNAGSCTSGSLEGAVNWASKWNLPVWITEFGCMGSSNPDEQTLLTFFNNSIPMLAKHPLVERYAWYPWNTHNHLYLEDASKVRVITALGKAFAAAPQYR